MQKGRRFQEKVKVIRVDNEPSGPRESMLRSRFDVVHTLEAATSVERCPVGSVALKLLRTELHVY